MDGWTPLMISQVLFLCLALKKPQSAVSGCEKLLNLFLGVSPLISAAPTSSYRPPAELTFDPQTLSSKSMKQPESFPMSDMSAHRLSQGSDPCDSGSFSRLAPQ